MNKVTVFELPKALEFEKLLTSIPKRYAARQDSTRTKKRTFFDTFDWRLYLRGLVLSAEGDTYRLESLATGTVAATVTLQSASRPKFWGQFPESALKNRLSQILDVRALLCVAEVRLATSKLRILNRDDKMVVRLQLEQLLQTDDKNNHIALIKLVAIRGYGKEKRELIKFLHRMGVAAQGESIFTHAVRDAGKVPGDYSSKLKVELTGGMTARLASEKILSHLFQTMLANEAGLKQDIDTEFLHDYRVAIRRTRSALAQVKGVFPKAETARFKKDFADLSKLSNRLRDLDVYLLKREEYRAMIPENLHSGLDTLFQSLKRERTREFRKFLNTLQRATYSKTKRSWEAFLNRQEKGPAKNASLPVTDLAKKRILQEHKQILDAGREIHEQSPDSELHNLRLECKKLRYLLEFFQSLFPARQIAFLIKQLKKLQDNLGDFNDLHVQQESLQQDYLEKSSAAGKSDIAAAVGGLVTVLYKKQQNVRTEFERTFADFQNQKNSNLFKQLFG